MYTWVLANKIIVLLPLVGARYTADIFTGFRAVALELRIKWLEGR